MRLSEVLNRKILSATLGRVIYSFGGKKRRHTLFFEDIFSEYIRECQEAGYSEQLREIGKGWMGRVVQQMIPPIAKKVPPTLFINRVMKPNLINLGLIDDLHISQKGNVVRLETKNEGVTRIVGRNEVIVGIYSGILSVLFDLQVKPTEVYQSKKICRYTFEVLDRQFRLESKDSETYFKLNEIPLQAGFTLEDALKMGVFRLREKNKIYFREKPIGPIENTVFHLFGAYGLLLDRVPHISYNYFNQVIDKTSSEEKKLSLLKTLLQSLGWGIVAIVIENERKISIKIKNPPYGLQTEKDNWTFLINTILGYLWTMDKRFKINSIKEEYKQLMVNYQIGE